jgi:hypothetical protein
MAIFLFISFRFQSMTGFAGTLSDESLSASIEGFI